MTTTVVDATGISAANLFDQNVAAGDSVIVIVNDKSDMIILGLGSGGAKMYTTNIPQNELDTATDLSLLAQQGIERTTNFISGNLVGGVTAVAVESVTGTWRFRITVKERRDYK
jgi:hypothetical protein